MNVQHKIQYQFDPAQIKQMHGFALGRAAIKEIIFNEFFEKMSDTIYCEIMNNQTQDKLFQIDFTFSVVSRNLKHINLTTEELQKQIETSKEKKKQAASLSDWEGAAKYRDMMQELENELKTRE